MRTRLAVFALVAVPYGRIGLCGEISKEDLSGCKLPHGEMVLPSRGSPKARKGYILRFSDQRLSVNPFEAEGKRPKSVEDFSARIKREHTGDILYWHHNEGSFAALSGRIADLGKHYLFELSDRALARPGKVWSKEERSSSGEATPGVLEHIQEGHCYLVEAVDGKYALVRLLGQRDRAATIQFVFQPDGSRKFHIPQGETTPVPQKQEQRPEPRWTSRARPLKKDIENHMRSRKALVTRLMALLSDAQRPARGARLSIEHGLAIRALGKLRAPEAAALLVTMVDWHGPFLDSSTLTIDGEFPAVPALVEIGKPGAEACLKALAVLSPAERKLPWRKKLLATVVLRVEGESTTRHLLQERINATDDESERKNLRDVLKSLEYLRSFAGVPAASTGRERAKRKPSAAAGPVPLTEAPRSEMSLKPESEVPGAPVERTAEARAIELESGDASSPGTLPQEGEARPLGESPERTYLVIGFAAGLALGAAGAWFLLRRRSWG